MLAESNPLMQRLQQIPYRRGLFSIPRALPNTLRDVEMDSKGFLFDLFSLAIAQRPNEEEWDTKQMEPQETNQLMSFIHRALVDFAESKRYPGPDALNLGQMPYSGFLPPTLQGSLEDMKANLVCSAPFKLISTTDSSEHLTMSTAGEIRLFWEGPCEEPDLPGRKTFMRFKHHSLAKSGPCQMLY
jgi:hypothetical protein